MVPLISPLLTVIGLKARPRNIATCLSCGHHVTLDDERTRLPGGGWVHRGCTSYRQRRQERIRRFAP